MKRKIKFMFQIIRFSLISYGIKWDDDKLQKDIKRWKEILCININDWLAMAQILWEKEEFRNLLIYRNRDRFIYRNIIKIIYPPLKTLYIDSFEIGGGLFIQHGFSTMIAAKSIGENCWINQQVTIGYAQSGEPPTIGNRVMITCGAKVLGDIKIEDNVIIGANAVVVKDVEANSVVGGVPAKKIK